MNYEELKLKLKDSVLIDEISDDDLTIASFNPKNDKIDNVDIMLDMPDLDFILDQDIYNSCVMHSLVLCAAILHYRKTNKWIEFDPYMGYGTVKPGQHSGIGMYPLQAISNCTDEGFYLRRDFGIEGERPSIISTVEKFKKNHPELVAQAKDFAFSSNARVLNPYDIKQALKMGMPVTATWRLYDSFFSKVGADGEVPVPKGDEDYIGNHQMTIIGIRKDDKYIVANSYGLKYGFKGIYFIPFKYSFAQAYSITDTIIPAKYKAKKIEMKIGDPNVRVDDTITLSDVSPVLIDDRTMIPVRLISEALGASVEWNDRDQTVIIRSEEAKIILKIGNRLYTVDGEPYYMDTVPILMNDRTLIPIRFLAEALNCEVSWNQEEETATIIAL